MEFSATTATLAIMRPRGNWRSAVLPAKLKQRLKVACTNAANVRRAHLVLYEGREGEMRPLRGGY